MIIFDSLSHRSWKKIYTNQYHSYQHKQYKEVLVQMYERENKKYFHKKVRCAEPCYINCSNRTREYNVKAAIYNTKNS